MSNPNISDFDISSGHVWLEQNNTCRQIWEGEQHINQVLQRRVCCPWPGLFLCLFFILFHCSLLFVCFFVCLFVKQHLAQVLQRRVRFPWAGFCHVLCMSFVVCFFVSFSLPFLFLFFAQTAHRLYSAQVSALLCSRSCQVLVAWKK